MRRYIEQGILPGHFLRAVICNDLVEATARADIVNSYRLHDFGLFLHYYVPPAAWGSEEKMRNWQARGGLKG